MIAGIARDRKSGEGGSHHGDTEEGWTIADEVDLVDVVDVVDVVDMEIQQLPMRAKIAKAEITCQN